MEPGPAIIGMASGVTEGSWSGSWAGRAAASSMTAGGIERETAAARAAWSSPVCQRRGRLCSMSRPMPKKMTPPAMRKASMVMPNVRRSVLPT